MFRRSARIFLISRAILSNDGLREGVKSQLERMTSIKGPQLRLDGGRGGLIFSTREDKGKIDIIWFTKLRTQNKTPHGVVIHEWPR